MIRSPLAVELSIGKYYQSMEVQKDLIDDNWCQSVFAARKLVMMLCISSFNTPWCRTNKTNDPSFIYGRSSQRESNDRKTNFCFVHYLWVNKNFDR